MVSQPHQAKLRRWYKRIQTLFTICPECRYDISRQDGKSHNSRQRTQTHNLILIHRHSNQHRQRVLKLTLKKMLLTN